MQFTEVSEKMHHPTGGQGDKEIWNIYEFFLFNFILKPTVNKPYSYAFHMVFHYSAPKSRFQPETALSLRETQAAVRNKQTDLNITAGPILLFTINKKNISFTKNLKPV